MTCWPGNCTSINCGLDRNKARATTSKGEKWGRWLAESSQAYPPGIGWFTCPMHEWVDLRAFYTLTNWIGNKLPSSMRCRLNICGVNLTRVSDCMFAKSPLAALLYDLALLQDQVKEKHRKLFQSLFANWVFLNPVCIYRQGSSIGVVLYRGCWKGSSVGVQKRMLWPMTLLVVSNFFP
jgi:hypothetical protein